MKAFGRFAALLVAVMLILTACSPKGKVNPPDLKRSFLCTAEMDYDGMTIKAQFDRTAVGVWSAEVLEPERLKGMRLEMKDGEVKLNFLGLSFAVPKKALPVKAAAEQIFDVLDNAADSVGTEFSKKGNTIEAAGEADGNPYTFSLDANTGALLSFAMPNVSLKADFTDFQFVENMPETVADSISENAPAP